MKTLLLFSLALLLMQACDQAPSNNSPDAPTPEPTIVVNTPTPTPTRMPTITPTPVATPTPTQTPVPPMPTCKPLLSTWSHTDSQSGYQTVLRLEAGDSVHLSEVHWGYNPFSDPLADTDGQQPRYSCDYLVNTTSSSLSFVQATCDTLAASNQATGSSTFPGMHNASGTSQTIITSDATIPYYFSTTTFQFTFGCGSLIVNSVTYQ